MRDEDSRGLRHDVALAFSLYSLCDLCGHERILGGN